MGTWVHHHHVPHPLPAATAQHRPASAGEQGPGLRALFRSTVMLPPRATSPSPFPYLRSIWPGHPDRPRTIRGKCWIASRSTLARPGQGGKAWPAGPSRSQGPPRALGHRAQASVRQRKNHRKTRKIVTFPGVFSYFRIPHQTNWRVFLSFLWQKLDPAPNKLESRRSGFSKPDLQIPGWDPVFPVFLVTFDRIVG